MCEISRDGKNLLNLANCTFRSFNDPLDKLKFKEDANIILLNLSSGFLLFVFFPRDKRICTIETFVCLGNWILIALPIRRLNREIWKN